MQRFASSLAPLTVARLLLFEVASLGGFHVALTDCRSFPPAALGGLDCFQIFAACGVSLGNSRFLLVHRRGVLVGGYRPVLLIVPGGLLHGVSSSRLVISL